jgi:hypothetical protein
LLEVVPALVVEGEVETGGFRLLVDTQTDGGVDQLEQHEVATATAAVTRAA